MKHLPFSIALSILCSTALVAQWTKTNLSLQWPDIPFCLTTRGTSLFVGTYGGIYHSTNEGNSWEKIDSGLTNPDVRSLAVGVANLFAGTANGGVFLSTNNGTSWIATGFNPGYTNALVVSGNNLFAGTSSGVYLSTNNGNDWIAIDSGLTRDNVISLATRGTTVFAGIYRGMMGYYAGVFRSTDNGQSWIDCGLSDKNIYALTVNKKHVFAGTEHGVYRSADNGSNWTAVDSALLNTGVFSFAFSDTSLFAATDNGVLLTTNNGITWTDVSEGLDWGAVNCLTIRGGYIFAGLENGCNNWCSVWRRPLSEMISTTQLDGLAGRSIKDIACGKDAIFAVTADSGSVYRSTDGGNTWTMTLPSGAVNVAASPSGTVVIQQQDTLLRSSDNGISWIPSITYQYGRSLTSVEVGPSGTILCGEVYGLYLTSSPAMLRSTDNGVSWSENTNRLASGVISFNGMSVVSAGGGYYCGAGCGAPGWIVSMSNDDGQNWITVSYAHDNSMGYAHSVLWTNTKILLGTEMGLFHSSDTCMNWRTICTKSISSGLLLSSNTILIGTDSSGLYLFDEDGDSLGILNEGLTNLNVHTLAMDSLGYVYAGTDSGIFIRPIDSILGITRRPQSLQAGWNLMSLPVHPFSHCKEANYPGSCSHAFEYSGSYRIHDTLEIGKGYWLKVPSASDFIIAGYRTALETVAVADRWNMIGSLSTPIAASSITSDPPGMITSTFWEYNGSAYVSSDTIRTGKGYWVKVNQPGKLILSSAGGGLTKSLSSRIRIAATSEYPPPPPDGNGIAEKAIPKEFTLGQNYPNPFNPSTEIRYQLPTPEWVTLKVFDILGQLVVTLMDEVKPRGEYTAVWDAQGMPSGVYFYRLTAGTFTDTKKMLLLR